MQVNQSETEELAKLYSEIKISGITSVSPGDLERFTELFTLTLPRSNDPLVRVD
jgi:hypothetical protein